MSCSSQTKSNPGESTANANLTLREVSPLAPVTADTVHEPHGAYHVDALGPALAT